MLSRNLVDRYWKVVWKEPSFSGASFSGFCGGFHAFTVEIKASRKIKREMNFRGCIMTSGR